MASAVAERNEQTYVAYREELIRHIAGEDQQERKCAEGIQNKKVGGTDETLAGMEKCWRIGYERDVRRQRSEEGCGESGCRSIYREREQKLLK